MSDYQSLFKKEKQLQGIVTNVFINMCFIESVNLNDLSSQCHHF